MRIKRGDKVTVMTGKDRGKSGVVVAADHAQGLVKVEGLNIYKRHQKKGGRSRQPGGIVEVIAPLSSAKVMLICPSCNRPTRVGYQTVGDQKRRVCKRCKALITDVKK
ncbi:MAG: 50S ribosomal protein L24 [bacterium]